MYQLNHIGILGSLQYNNLQQKSQQEDIREYSQFCAFQSDATIVDHSKFNHRFQVKGNVKPSIVSPQPAQLGAAYFKGGFIVTDSSSDFALHNTFTVELFILPKKIEYDTVVFDIGSSDKPGFLRINTDRCLYTSVNDSKNIVASKHPLQLNKYTHVAIVSDSAGTRLYVNGVKAAYARTSSSWTTESRPMYIGGDCGGGSNFYGYMSNFRIFKGIALYTSNFAIPTEPLSTFIPKLDTK